MFGLFAECHAAHGPTQIAEKEEVGSQPPDLALHDELGVEIDIKWRDDLLER